MRIDEVKLYVDLASKHCKDFDEAVDSPPTWSFGTHEILEFVEDVREPYMAEITQLKQAILDLQFRFPNA